MSGDVRGELAEALERSTLAAFVADPVDVADVLLPVVERIAREAAAEALREEAAELREVADLDPDASKWNPRRVIQWLEGRAESREGHRG